MVHWQVRAKISCVFCDEPIEDRDHLFFKCCYAKEIWSGLSSKLLGQKFSTRWGDILKTLTDKSLGTECLFLTRYAFQLAIYSIWRERNSRRHGESPSPPAQLLRNLDKEVTWLNRNNGGCRIYCIELVRPITIEGWSDDDPSEVEAPTASKKAKKAKKARRNWSATEDVVLISGWLNTSKDPVVGNEQKHSTFWERIAAYYNTSPKLKGVEKRGHICCKQRWSKVNDAVNKFVGSYLAASKQQTSGQNDDDVVTLAHQIYSKDYGCKFTLEYAWRDLRYEQKWCAQSTHGKSKIRKPQSEHISSSAVPVGVEENEARPTGVKAAKAAAKAKGKAKVSSVEETNGLKEIQSIWEIKEKDHAAKEKLISIKEKKNRTKLLERLYAKVEPLSEIEEKLKNKLINEMLSS